MVTTYTSPFAGFDLLGKKFADLNTSANFPPYNIRKINDTEIVLELAVAGFNKNNISIVEDGGALIIEGKKPDDTDNYLYKGIATRMFKRAWSLADNLYVDGAEIIDGVLYVKLHREVPEKEKPKVIPISDKKPIRSTEYVSSEEFIEGHKKWKSRNNNKQENVSYGK